MPWRTFCWPTTCSRGSVAVRLWASALCLAVALARAVRRSCAFLPRPATRSAWRSSGVRAGRALVLAALAARARWRRSLGASTSWGSDAGALASGAAVCGASAVSSAFSGVWSSAISCLTLDVDFSFARDGERTGHLALGAPQPRGVVQLARGVLKAQAEQLAPRGGNLLSELVVGEVAYVAGAHQASSRITNLVRTGSLCPASRMASRASSSSTPASSNMTRPGLTTATQPSGDPLPEPIRVSAGFLVNGLSGYTLIQTFPPRRILRVMAIRAASIWRLVSQPASNAFRPYSPNWTFT